MTVSSSNNRDDYAGNGSTTSFAVTFRFLQNSDVKATIRDSSGGETLQVETTNYTLTGAGDAGGGTLVMLVAPPTGETLTILRDVPATQETDYVENDEFPAESHEDALDKLTMLVQQQAEDSTRHMGFSETVSDATGSAVELSQDKTQRADKLLGFDSAGNLVTKTTFDQGSVDQAVFDKRYGPIFATVAAMVAANPVSIDGIVVTLVAGMTVETQGRTTVGDGGGAKYLVVASQAADELGDHTNANGTVSVLQVSGTVNVIKYGVVEGGSIDVSAAYQAAADSGLELFTPPGDYLFSSEVTITNQGQRIRGSGWGSVAGGATARLLTTTDIKTFKVTGNFVFIEGFFFDNTASTMSAPHVHFAGDAFSSIDRCRLQAVENFTALGGGILIDDGAGGIGGSVALINNINISHGTVTVKRSDVHIKNSWLWANSRPFVVRGSGAVGNLVMEGCDLLPPQTLVAGRKAAVYLDGAMSAPRLLGCNFDGNVLLSTGSGLLAENGIINLLVSGCFGFGHNEDCIIVDSCIAPIVSGNTFTNNNTSEDGSTDITLRDTFAQLLERPLIQGNAFTQTAVLSGTAGPAVKLVATTNRNGVRIIDNTIHQPGAGGGYTDIEIDLEDGAFASTQVGSLAGNRGARTHYMNSGTQTIAIDDTFETVNYGVTMAYAPRPDQINLSFASTANGVNDWRFNSAGLPTTAAMGLGFAATHAAFDLYWEINL